MLLIHRIGRLRLFAIGRVAGSRAWHLLDKTSLHHSSENAFDLVIRSDVRDFSRLPILDRRIALKEVHDRLFGRGELFVFDHDKYRVVLLFDRRGFEAELVHSFECRVKPLANVFVGRVRKLVEDANDATVSGKALVQNIVDGDVRRELAGALHFNAIVENSDVSARMIGCRGKVQREGEVIHVIAEHLTDLSGLLGQVGGRDEELRLPHGRGDRAKHGGGPDPHGALGRKPRDIYIPDLRIEGAINVRTRDFR
jgi:hypothetical protein